MTEGHMIPDAPDREIDWSLDAEAVLEMGRAAETPEPLRPVEGEVARGQFA